MRIKLIGSKEVRLDPKDLEILEEFWAERYEEEYL